MIGQQNVIDALYLKILSSIGSEVGNRVYENEAPQDAALPLCTFNIVADTPDMWFVTDSLNCDVQINIFGWKRLGAKAIRIISDTLFNDLHRFELEIDEYDYSFVDGTNRGASQASDNVVSIRTEFNIKASEQTNIS